MSENGSNVSIEEIGSEEIEQIEVNEDAEVLIPDSHGEPQVADKPTAGEEVSSTTTTSEEVPKAAVDDDDPPLENLTPAAPIAAPAAPIAEPAAPIAEPAAPVAEPAAPVAEPAAVAASEPALAAAPAAGLGLAGSGVEVIEEVPRPPQVDPPARNPVQAQPEEDDEEEDDDDIDETLAERLIGLTEMFPESLRRGTVSLVKGSWSGTKYLYGFTRSAGWIFFSTASILFMPVMIETERLSIMDQQKQQKTQMLLGPGVAASGAPSLGPPPI